MNVVIGERRADQVPKIRTASPKGETWETHPEIYHYTNLNGLKGILSSNNIWATHYAYLNDSSELTIFRRRLPDLLAEPIRSLLRSKLAESASMARKIRKSGGVHRLTADISKELADTFYRLAFEPDPGSTTVTTPFIASFCGHTTDDPYVRANGLLSLCRAYGAGGYPIVLDSKRMWELCQRENDHFAYQLISFSESVYADDHDAFQIEFGRLLKTMRESAIAVLTKDEPPSESSETPVALVVSAFARMKHQGFREEREVRIIACPRDEPTQRLMAKKHPELTSLPIKRVEHRKVGDTCVPYIELFNADSRRLPIKRIIVGPQKNQDLAYKAVRELIANRRISVRCSETPLVSPLETN